MSDVFVHLDEVLDRVFRLRDELLADPAAPNRATRLASVFEYEARTWSQLYELSSLRLIWRAALAAEAGARANAEAWGRRATAGAIDTPIAAVRLGAGETATTDLMTARGGRR